MRFQRGDLIKVHSYDGYHRVLRVTEDGLPVIRPRSWMTEQVILIEAVDDHQKGRGAPAEPG